VTAKKKTDVVSVLIVAALMVGAILMGWQEVLESKLLRPGTAAPDFTVQTFEGGPVTLSSLKGKVVLVDFWATWCGPCVHEMPYLLSTVKAFEAQGVTLVALSNDDLGSQREVIGEFAKRFPALKAYAALGTPEVGSAYLVHSLPTLYVIDREGLIVAAQAGQAQEWQLKRWVEKALERGAVGTAK
jgi:peroxiredoxin